MEKASKSNGLISGAVAIFASAVGLGFYAGTFWQDAQSYDDAYNAGYQAFQDELDVCRDAQISAGKALGDYILGENDITEVELDNLEAAAEALCVKFE